MSSAYDSLDPRVRKWVYKQGWSTLRPLQESSIPAILARDRDVLISAGTAAGKTGLSFFLPVRQLQISRMDLASSISVR
jgi:ATP-dependent Lhr-like helicase